MNFEHDELLQGEQELHLAEPSLSELKSIKRSLMKRNTVIIGIAILVIIALSLLWNVAIVPLGNLFFYDPWRNDFTTFMVVEASLTSPGMSINAAQYINDGIGRHSANFEYTNRRNENRRQTFLFEYSKMDIPFGEDHRESTPLFAWDFVVKTIERDVGEQPRDKAVLEDFANIADVFTVAAFVSFDEHLSMNELVELRNCNDDLELIWAGVAASDSCIQSMFYGFNMRTQSLNLTSGEKYPYLVLTTADYWNTEITGGIYERHFCDMLRFMIDNFASIPLWQDADVGVQREFVEQAVQSYENALDFVEQNGVYAHGVIIRGTPADIIALYEAGNVSDIVIDNVQFRW